MLMSRRKIKAHVFTGFSETGWGGVIITLRLWGKAVTEWTNEWELRLETAKEPSPLVRHVIPLYSIPNLYIRLVQDAVPEDLCINKSLESLRIFLKGRAEVRKRLTPCFVDSTQTSLYALQCQCGHGCWLDYAKNVMQFLRTGRGFAEVERRFWPGGGVETRAIFFFQKSKARNEGAKAEEIERLPDSLPSPSPTAAGRRASCSKLARTELITREKLPLGSSWHTRLSPELLSSSTEQLFWEQMRKFIFTIGIEQPPGPQRRSNVRISVEKRNLPLLRKVQMSAPDVIQDGSLIKVLET